MLVRNLNHKMIALLKILLIRIVIIKLTYKMEFVRSSVSTFSAKVEKFYLNKWIKDTKKTESATKETNTQFVENY